MKKICVLAISLMVVPTAMVVAQQPVENNPLEEMQLLQGVGPALSGSVDYAQLPEKARDFISSNFNDVKVVSTEKEFASDTYEIVLNNGIELEFYKNGNIKEIESEDSTLPADIVKRILPEAATKTLENKALHTAVKSIEIKGGSFEVEFARTMALNLKTMKFDTLGNTTEVE